MQYAMYGVRCVYGRAGESEELAVRGCCGGGGKKEGSGGKVEDTWFLSWVGADACVLDVSVGVGV